MQMKVELRFAELSYDEQDIFSKRYISMLQPSKAGEDVNSNHSLCFLHTKVYGLRCYWHERI